MNHWMEIASPLVAGFVILTICWLLIRKEAASSDGLCRDCGEPCGLWFAPNEI